MINLVTAITPATANQTYPALKSWQESPFHSMPRKMGVAHCVSDR